MSDSALHAPASRRLPDPRAALELIRPVTWFPPIWAYLCGVVSVGIWPGEAWPLVLLGVLLAGPIVCGMSQAIRKLGAPIPLKPLDRWDDGRDVVPAGDAAGVVAPSSGEGSYYAMVGGRVAATAAQAALASGRAHDLRLARKLFMREHRTVFRVLRSMQDAYYKSDERRERFVSLCHDIDVQRLTFEAYMNKKLVKARPMAHLKIGVKNLMHLTGLVRPEYT